MPKAMNDNQKADPGAPAGGKPCPICGKPSSPEARPFCSKRCADVDLHRWLGGTYAIPVAEDQGEERPDIDEE